MFAGTAAAAAGGASGLWLFSYNKENFGFDAGMRFGRFMMARGNANAQVAQYREDIQGIVGTTVSKMDAWQTVTTLFLAVGAALSCAGRIGMHGCAPPGWYCSLFSGCIFMSVMFNGTSLWLSMHAALRAQCAAVSLLTRKVRLPIPSMGQMDQARVFGSSFEKQEWRDIFRIPFMRHPKAVPEMPVGKQQEGKGKKKAHDPQREFASTSRHTMPSWMQDEVVVDKGDGFKGDGQAPVHDELEAPEHFQLLMKAQEEWRDFDVYARITMLYGVVSFLYAVTYYAVGTAISELRGFWVMWSVPLVFLSAQALILRLDILRHGQQRLPNAEWIGHIAPYFAVIACTLEYRFFYSEAQTAVAWSFALLAHFGHLVMALRMLDLAWPESSAVKDMPEEPGKEWWPGSWQVPRSFTKHLWFITPPSKLDPNVSPCLLHEMDDMAKHGGGVEYRRAGKKGLAPGVAAAEPAGSKSSPYEAFNVKRGNNLPWQITRVVILTAALQWLFTMVVTCVEIVLGPESLLKPPGEPPWIRDTKYRTWGPEKVHLSTSDGLPEDYRLFSASTAHYSDGKVAGHATDHTPTAGHTSTSDHATTSDHASSAGNAIGDTADDVSHDLVVGVAVEIIPSHHRRLSKANATDAAMDELFKLVPMLGDLLERMGEEANKVGAPAETAEHGQVAVPFMAPAPKVRPAMWPSFFSPRHLACGHGAAAALTPRGFGAALPLGGPVDEEARAEPFSLDGLGGSGPITGTAWLQSGLHVVTASGDILECTGQRPPADGIWPCVSASLPRLPGGDLASAALAEGGLAAAVFSSTPQLASLFRMDTGKWHPFGEVHIPPALVGTPGLAFLNGELAIIGKGGEVHRKHLHTGSVRGHVAPGGGASRHFHGACSGPSGETLHLALNRASTVWGPELIAV